MEIRWLDPSELARRKLDLAEILADCVEGGASVHFMLPLSLAAAQEWWEGAFVGLRQGAGVIWGGFIAGQLLGTAQLALDMPPNQRPRGEVRKVLVHRRARRRGMARALMAAVEAEARARGLELLTLDAQIGSGADVLYESIGFQCAGIIPGFAHWPDGRLGDSAYYWKKLEDET